MRVVELFEGDPDQSLVGAGHTGGLSLRGRLARWTRAELPRRLDAISLSLGGGGGRPCRGRSPLDKLLPAILGAVRVPVVAAGGIGTAERVAELVAEGRRPSGWEPDFWPAPNATRTLRMSKHCLQRGPLTPFSPVISTTTAIGRPW